MGTTRIFLTAAWRYLVMANYEIDPAVLKALVPAGTELDRWNGTAYVSVVGFLFERANVLGIGFPFHRNFEEVNLRFYVRRKVSGEWRRGVAFIKEIVPRWAIAAVARTVYGEKYVALPMQHKIQLPKDGDRGRIEYSWVSGSRRNVLAAAIEGEPQPLAPGSEAEFITEHYWGYAARTRGRVIEYEVSHSPWGVWHTDDVTFDCDIQEIYGNEFFECLSCRPKSAFVATGSEVSVHSGKRL